MDLKKVKKKLQVRSSQQYRSVQDFVSDVRLVFHNCSKYNEVGGMSPTRARARMPPRGPPTCQGVEFMLLLLLLLLLLLFIWKGEEEEEEEVVVDAVVMCLHV